jgi:peptidoglycan glycosyltransferase
MGRRIRWLGVIMVVCLGLVIAQLVNIQLIKGKQLQTSPYNPRIAVLHDVNPRGEILAADGTVLAKSIPTPAGTNKSDYPYENIRQYPEGSLYSGITGYDSVLNYGLTGIELEYDSYLGPHQQPPQTLSQLLFREKTPIITDDVTLTVEPKLQEAAQYALSTMPPGLNKDGAVVVLDPKTGAVLAMYSSPSYDPNAMVSTSLPAEHLAYLSYTGKDHEGFYPLRPLATGETFFPGSTMKVVTSTAVYNLKPLLAGFNYPVAPCQKFTDSNKLLCNDGSSPSNSDPCGGTMTVMLPQSCDPGYGELGIQEGVSTLRQQAELFGINAQPPIDLPSNSEQSVGGVVESQLQALPDNAQALQAYSAIGQETVQDSALQNAMVAAGIANGGALMTPHLMSSIHNSLGSLVKTYTPTLYKQAASESAAQSVTALMEGVITNPTGTAAGVGFPPLPVRSCQNRNGSNGTRREQ